MCGGVQYDVTFSVTNVSTQGTLFCRTNPIRSQRWPGCCAQAVPNDENRHIRLVGQPVTLSRTPGRMAARPPEFGEQTEEVLAEFGFGTDEVVALKQAKVV
jgi:hypothetical protein